MKLIKKHIIIITFLVGSLTVLQPDVHADVIITTDNMLLNGKVLQKDKNRVTFGNYYGIFNIQWKQIRKLYETKSAEDDIKIYKTKRKKVNIKEVKRNYQEGLKKKMKKTGKSGPPFYMQLSLIPVYYATLLDLKDTLPFSYSGVLSMDLYNVSFTHIKIEADYQYLKKEDDFIHGTSLAIGPLFATQNPRFNIQVAPMIGIGYYFIETYNTQDEKFSKTKLGLTAKFTLGFSITFGSFVIMPQARASYIYDGASPLLGVGGGLSFGVKL